MTQPTPCYEVGGSIRFMVPANTPEEAAAAINNFITHYVADKVRPDNLVEGMIVGTILDRSSFNVTSTTQYIPDGTGGWTPAT